MVTSAARPGLDGMTIPAPGRRPTHGDPGAGLVDDFEIHSELAVVCPEVRSHALTVLANERAMHLMRYRPTYVAAASGRPRETPFIVALGAYTARAAAYTALLAATTGCAVVLIALAAALAGH